MANTYTRLHIQFVFAVKYRTAMIDNTWKDRLHGYMTGIVQNHNHKMLQINSMPDHIHIFIGLNPEQSISSLMQRVKTDSSAWINDSGFCKSKFLWQKGYGAFSYARSQVDTVIRYIQNQEQHHRKQTFLDEYRKFLTVFEVDWDERYIFKEPE
ncbi:IS200/IS605 family transposase [Parafilimonas sp.]|uniref:IS200/IS605 family transposase n=1 Tax=Parafilimonas sp. TaxID=1969739 RepID=UPI0039E508E8